ncbi:MAG: BCCT family transporter [Symploca sp. SIO2E6]|nr:BCCT family transporter [Symploca sp. SIO2E6]
MTTKRSHPKPRGRTPGDTNIQGWGFDLHPQVSFISGGLIILFIVLTLIFNEQADVAFKAIQNLIANTTGWFLILVTNIYLGVVIILAFSKFGKIRIGGEDAQPEFSTFAWYAMLFSAGMGAGLLFWGIAEPISHFQTPPLGSEAGTAAAAEEAMGIIYFHWGLHGWGIYTLVGLSLAFFAFNRGLPLTIRSVFYPLLGEKIYEWPGNLIDILAVVSTLFGLATSLGFGAQQVNAGLNLLVGLPNNVVVQVILIAIITSFATLSVVAGLDGGVRRLSEWNIYIAIAFFAFMLLIGPTQFILDFFVQSLGYYIGIFPTISFWTEAFEGAFEGTNWQNGWTIFYWAWWIAWSPFVGIFIARVSKGRTVREFVLGVLFLPSFLSFIWMSCFGGSALSLALKDIGNLPEAVEENMATGLFVMLQQFPLTSVSSFIGLLLVITFFVTSSDSGSLVVDNLTSGGKLDSPVPQRVFWAVMEGVVAAVLLLGGGLTALQTAATTTGLPFAIVLLIMCFSLHRGLTEDWAELEVKQLRKMEARRETETIT